MTSQHQHIWDSLAEEGFVIRDDARQLVLAAAGYASAGAVDPDDLSQLQQAFLDVG